MSTPFGQIMQHGYIVADVDKAAREWSERMNIGPFYVIDQTRLDEYYYRGKLTDLEMKLAFGYWGNIQIELIQPLSTTDTLYTRALKDEAGKLNHCATTVSDLDALIASHKLQGKEIQAGSMKSGVKFVYLDRWLPGGLHLEIVQQTKEGLMGNAAMEAVAQKWDGKNPVRPIAALGEDIARLQKAG
jgi:methylmalonyl-CoA/ethylmalonyl-CoA epimerase